MAIATSGTVGAFQFTTRKIIEHSWRRCGWRPQKLGAEAIGIATDLLYLLSTEWVNAGFPLWTRQFSLLSITVGSPDVNTPAGTVDVMHAYWRTFQPYRGACMLSTGAGNTSLFAGAVSPDVVVTSVNPGATVNFTSPTEVDTVGVLLGGSMTLSATSFDLYISSDGLTYSLAQSLPEATYVPGAWTYFDLDPTITSQYLRLQLTGGTTLTLNQLQFGLANGTDIELGIENIDDYYNLPNKLFQGDRPTSIYNDRQLNGPVLKQWPVPNTGAFFNGTISALTRRYLQDPGSMTQIIEAPPRWYEAAIARLAAKMIVEMPDDLTSDGGQMSYLAMAAKQQRMQTLEQNAVKAEGLAWAEERAKGPVRLMPSIAPYTR